MADLSALQQTLGVSFKTPSLLSLALTHSSYINENPECCAGSNERLEFLGDAVLGLVVAEKLYRDFPDLTEGEMTKLRSVLIRRETLARIATNIGLGSYLYLGKGEARAGGRQNPANLASLTEAVIGAVFLDQGFVVATELVLRLFGEEIDKTLSAKSGDDYKSRLQEALQSRRQQTPTYRLIEATGPDHHKVFTVEVLAGDMVLGKGAGHSKKQAEMEAARLALEHFTAHFTQ